MHCFCCRHTSSQTVLKRAQSKNIEEEERLGRLCTAYVTKECLVHIKTPLDCSVDWIHSYTTELRKLKPFLSSNFHQLTFIQSLIPVLIIWEKSYLRTFKYPPSLFLA
jgi:hypothetical protein